MSKKLPLLHVESVCYAFSRRFVAVIDHAAQFIYQKKKNTTFLLHALLYL